MPPPPPARLPAHPSGLLALFPGPPPSLNTAAHSACVPAYLLQPIIVPTYGVSSCEPQFRGSEILLSDCHNASASGGPRVHARPPPSPLLLCSPLSPLSTPQPPPSLLSIPDLKCFFLLRCSTCAPFFVVLLITLSPSNTLSVSLPPFTHTHTHTHCNLGLQNTQSQHHTASRIRP